MSTSSTNQTSNKKRKLIIQPDTWTNITPEEFEENSVTKILEPFAPNYRKAVYNKYYLEMKRNAGFPYSILELERAEQTIDTITNYVENQQRLLTVWDTKGSQKNKDLFKQNKEERQEVFQWLSRELYKNAAHDFFYDLKEYEEEQEAKDKNFESELIKAAEKQEKEFEENITAANIHEPNPN